MDWTVICTSETLAVTLPLPTYHNAPAFRVWLRMVKWFRRCCPDKRTKQQHTDTRTDRRAKSNVFCRTALLGGESIETHSTSLWCNVCVAVTRSYSHSVLTVHAQVQLSTLLQLTKKAASIGPTDENVLCSNLFLRTFYSEAFWWRLFEHSRLGNGHSTHGFQTLPFSHKTRPRTSITDMLALFW